MIKTRYTYSNGNEIKTFVYTTEDIREGIESNQRVLLFLKGFKLIGKDTFTEKLRED